MIASYAGTPAQVDTIGYRITEDDGYGYFLFLMGT